MEPDPRSLSKVAAAEAGSRPDQMRRVALASAVGTTIEWYDYFIYSTAAALVFGSQFFTTLEPASATLASFATLARSRRRAVRRGDRAPAVACRDERSPRFAGNR